MASNKKQPRVTVRLRESGGGGFANPELEQQLLGFRRDNATSFTNDMKSSDDGDVSNDDGDGWFRKVLKKILELK